MLLVALLLAATLPTTAPATQPTLEYRGCVRLPEANSGLSAITYTGGGDEYWGALEWDAKLVRLKMKIAADGSIASAVVESSVALPKDRRDLEGIAMASKESVFISSEAPAIFEARLSDGKIIRDLPVPPIMRGIAANYGFESLTISGDGKTLWTANERALKIDGNPGTPAVPISAVTRVRLQRYERRGKEFALAEQFEYQTSGVHDWGGTIGLCDLAALPNGKLLALERSAAQNFDGVTTIRTRIFLVDPTGATDISKPPYDAGLVDREPKKVSKTLLFDGLVCDENGENLEGICLGPQLSPGRFAVIGVVDNTDGGLGVSKPAVVAFELKLSSGEGK